MFIKYSKMLQKIMMKKVQYSHINWKDSGGFRKKSSVKKTCKKIKGFNYWF
jgi:hypothetical protein